MPYITWVVSQAGNPYDTGRPHQAGDMQPVCSTVSLSKKLGRSITRAFRQEMPDAFFIRPERLDLS